MKDCLFCFYSRPNERKEVICWKHGRNLDKLMKEKLVQIAERCKDFRDDQNFTRLRYPIGVTPEEEKEKRKAAVLAALKEGESV